MWKGVKQPSHMLQVYNTRVILVMQVFKVVTVKSTKLSLDSLDVKQIYVLRLKKNNSGKLTNRTNICVILFKII